MQDKGLSNFFVYLGGNFVETVKKLAAKVEKNLWRAQAMGAKTVSAAVYNTSEAVSPTIPAVINFFHNDRMLMVLFEEKCVKTRIKAFIKA